jgi:hypothetical protein
MPAAWLRDLLLELSQLAQRPTCSNSASPPPNRILCAFTSVGEFQNSSTQYKSMERRVVKYLRRK